MNGITIAVIALLVAVILGLFIFLWIGKSIINSQEALINKVMSDLAYENQLRRHYEKRCEELERRLK